MTRRLALVCLLAAAPALAEEGMWMPQQVPSLAPRLRELGFAGDPAAFADLTRHPMNAVISLGGCSASFVSPEGLIATNHHCVVGTLQYNSTPQRNLLKEGFLAKTREEELWNGPGSRVMVTVSVTEVTDDLAARLSPEMDDRARYDAIDRWEKERLAACEKGGMRCRVAPFFEGLRWFEIAQLEIEDVRLVYAPAQGIGVFGGETDNWQWPRHTGDFAFYRAYVGPDGKPAPHARENVPFRPAHWLRVSPAGASPGEFVLVAGYPGNTDRHETLADTATRVEFTLPTSIRRLSRLLEIAEEVSAGQPETAIALASRKRGFANALKKNRGVLEGLTRGGFLAEKERNEKALAAWIAAEPSRAGQFGTLFQDLDALQKDIRRTRERDSALAFLEYASNLYGAAETLHRLALETGKPDAQRDPEFQERNWPRIRERLTRLQRSIDPRADRALLRYALTEAARLPQDQRLEPVDAWFGLKAGMSDSEAAAAIDERLPALYAGSRLHEKDFRLGLLLESPAELAAAKDSLLQFAAALHPFAERVRDDGKRRKGAGFRIKPRLMQALLAHHGGAVAPDANGTLRVTFGKVAGVKARDGLFYEPQTTLAGILEKHTGEGEFDAPRPLLEAIRALRAGRTKSRYVDPRLGDIPVNFLSTVDTTGGNSGSAVLNARGELCGLLFDGTYDTVASDLVYDTVRTRAIQVDSRYLLWVMTEVDGAAHLVKEMGL